VPGCNLRCPFCHNWRIVIDPKPPFLSDNAALKILKNRKKYIDAVVITGGEPTLHKDLPEFLIRLKDKGFYTKLDTNGYFPNILQECLPFIDYLAMDIKTIPKKYALLGTTDVNRFMKSIDIIKNSKVDYEFRTTLVPGLVTKEDLIQIGELISGAKKLILQQFIPTDTLDKKYEKIKPYSTEKIELFAKTLKKYVKNISLRL
jgi:pyruvate formate lyase activating enzyme